MRILYIVIAMSSLHLWADNLDKDQQAALQQTKDLLRDSKQRQVEINKDPKATDIDKKVDALAGTAKNKDEMYDIAAQLMDKIAVEAQGDPAKMQELMIEAQKNPEAFYNKYFDSAQKDHVRNLATKIEKNQPVMGSK
jgi:hypothetical protein